MQIMPGTTSAGDDELTCLAKAAEALITEKGNSQGDYLYVCMGF